MEMYKVIEESIENFDDDMEAFSDDLELIYTLARYVSSHTSFKF